MSRRRYKKNRTGLYMVVSVVGLFLMTLIWQGISLNANCQKLATEQSQLEEKKKALKEEQEAIKDKAKYMKTDAYIEDVAREKFGLVYKNEIIFKAAGTE